MLEKLERKDKRRGAKGNNNMRICFAILLKVLAKHPNGKESAKATESARRKDVLSMRASDFV